MVHLVPSCMHPLPSLCPLCHLTCTWPHPCQALSLTQALTQALALTISLVPSHLHMALALPGPRTGPYSGPGLTLPHFCMLSFMPFTAGLALALTLTLALTLALAISHVAPAVSKLLTISHASTVSHPLLPSH